jgi:hypothetical protein
MWSGEEDKHSGTFLISFREKPLVGKSLSNPKSNILRTGITMENR